MFGTMERQGVAGPFERVGQCWLSFGLPGPAEAGDESGQARGDPLRPPSRCAALAIRAAVYISPVSPETAKCSSAASCSPFSASTDAKSA